MTQNEKILNHLENRGSITPLEAMDLYGIMRLGTRIHELKKAGYPVSARKVDRRNRYGEKVSVSEYRLIK